MSHSDEPLRLKLPGGASFKQRLRWMFRGQAVVVSIIAAGWWFGLVWSLFSPEEENQWMLSLGAVGLTLYAALAHRLARWGRV